MESLKPCCYIWMSEDWGLHIRHRNPLVKISVSLMVHQESLLVLDSHHSINFHWPHQALKESVNNTVWPSWATKQDTTYRVKEFPQLKLKGNTSQPRFGVTHEHLPSPATPWHVKVHIKFRSIFFCFFFFCLFLTWVDSQFLCVLALIHEYSGTKAERQKGTENQPWLKNVNLNLILTCNIHTLHQRDQRQVSCLSE